MPTVEEFNQPHRTGTADIGIMNEILSSASRNAQYAEALAQSASKYHLSQFKIMTLTPQKVREEFDNLRARVYANTQRTSKANSWFDKELRIFVWALVCYCHAHQCQIEHLTQTELLNFCHTFGGKDLSLVQFQTKLLCCGPGKGKSWTLEEDNILQTLIGPKNSTTSWNEISKQLYQLSEKQFFRTPKQCRERWLNHLDPTVSHHDWSLQEDVFLLEQVIEVGKKWAHIKRSLHLNRTQHSVKNRYNSLLRPYLDRDGATSERSAAGRLLYRLRRELSQQESKQQNSIEENFQIGHVGRETPTSMKENSGNEQCRLSESSVQNQDQKEEEKIVQQEVVGPDEIVHSLVVEKNEQKAAEVSHDRQIFQCIFDVCEF